VPQYACKRLATRGHAERVWTAHAACGALAATNGQPARAREPAGWARLAAYTRKKSSSLPGQQSLRWSNTRLSYTEFAHLNSHSLHAPMPRYIILRHNEHLASIVKKSCHSNLNLEQSYINQEGPFSLWLTTKTTVDLILALCLPTYRLHSLYASWCLRVIWCWFCDSFLLHHYWRLFAVMSFRNLSALCCSSSRAVTVNDRCFHWLSDKHLKQYARWYSAWLVIFLEYSTYLASLNHCFTGADEILKGIRSDTRSQRAWLAELQLVGEQI
jgi:hypothetical protein